MNIVIPKFTNEKRFQEVYIRQILEPYPVLAQGFVDRLAIELTVNFAQPYYYFRKSSTLECDPKFTVLDVCYNTEHSSVIYRVCGQYTRGFEWYLIPPASYNLNFLDFNKAEDYSAHYEVKELKRSSGSFLSVQNSR